MGKEVTWENTFRIHDQAVYNWLGGLRVDYGVVFGKSMPNDSILRIMATPDTAFAKMADILIRKGMVPEPTNPSELSDIQYAFQIVPLPLCSIYRQSADINLFRSNVLGTFRRYTYDAVTGKYNVHRYPGTFQLPYQVDFWMAKKYTEAWLYEWLLEQMGRPGAAPNEAFIEVDHGEAWGVQLQALKLNSLVDTTQIEEVENDRRYLRFTADFSLNGLLMHPVERQVSPLLKVVTHHHNTLLADGITNVDGVHLETSVAAMNFYGDDGTVEDRYLNAYFEKSANIDVKRSKKSSDGRINQFTGKTLDGSLNYGVFEFTYKEAGYVGFGGLKLPGTKNLLAVRFRYLSPATPLTFQVTDGFGNPTQTWAVPRTKKWMQFECFTWFSGNFGMRWDSPLAGAVVNVDHIQHQWVQEGEAGEIIPSSEVPGSGEFTHTFTGLNWKKGYMIVGEWLNTVGMVDIVIKNDAVSPTHQESVTVDLGLSKNFGFIAQPKHQGNTVTLTTVGTPVNIALVRAYEYLGSIKGRLIPV